MNIGILGYGKMGREVELAAIKKGHSLIWKINSSNRDLLTPELIKTADVVIEFTTPHTAETNIRLVIENSVPIVSGSTGWFDRIPEMKEFCKNNKGALFYTSNFSIGVNLFFEASRYLSDLVAKYPEYSAFIEEIHHTRKLDAPSGTAITLAEKIVSAHSAYSSWDMGNTSIPSAIPITAIRKNDVPGTHTLTFEGPDDKLVFTHEAFGRRGFAAGAIRAAEWILDKKGVFTMDDMLKS